MEDPPLQADDREKEREKEAELDDKVNTLLRRHEKGQLHPDFIEKLRGKQGWEFLSGPGEQGWDYFVDRFEDRYSTMLQQEVFISYAKGAFASKFLKSQQVVDTWRSEAKQRRDAGYKLQYEGDSSRLLRLSNIGSNIKPKLFKILTGFGTLEYCDFEMAESAKTDTNYTCLAQFNLAAQSQKVLTTIMKKSKAGKASNFMVELDSDGSLLPPSTVLRLASGAGAGKKVSEMDLAEIAEVFAVFAVKPPSIVYEKAQYSTDYDSVILTFDECADAEAALLQMQKPLSDTLNFELHYITDETKAEHMASWVKSGGSVGALHHGGFKVPLRDVEADEPLRPSSEYLDVLEGYQLMGDGTLQRSKGLSAFQLRYLFLDHVAREKRLRLRAQELPDASNWSEDPGAEFSTLRLRKYIDVYDEGGQVGSNTLSPDYEAGSYVHLNPEEKKKAEEMAAAAAAARKAADDLFANAGTVRERGPEADDVDIDLAIDGEEEFADSRPQLSAAPAGLYRGLQDKIAQRQRAPQPPPPPPQPTPEELRRAEEEKERARQRKSMLLKMQMMQAKQVAAKPEAPQAASTSDAPSAPKAPAVLAPSSAPPPPPPAAQPLAGGGPLAGLLNMFRSKQAGPDAATLPTPPPNPLLANLLSMSGLSPAAATGAAPATAAAPAAATEGGAAAAPTQPWPPAAAAAAAPAGDSSAPKEAPAKDAGGAKGGGGAAAGAPRRGFRLFKAADKPVASEPKAEKPAAAAAAHSSRSARESGRRGDGGGSGGARGGDRRERDYDRDRRGKEKEGEKEKDARGDRGHRDGRRRGGDEDERRVDRRDRDRDGRRDGGDRDRDRDRRGDRRDRDYDRRDRRGEHGGTRDRERRGGGGDGKQDPAAPAAAPAPLAEGPPVPVKEGPSQPKR